MRKFLNIFGFLTTCIGGGVLGAYVVLGGTVGIIAGAVLFFLGLIIVIVASLIPSKSVVKNRTSFKIDFSCDRATADEKIQKFLGENGFKQRQYLDEIVYQKGEGFWTARYFLKYQLEENYAVVEAWISSGLGKTVTTEIPLDSKFYGSLVKTNLRNLVNLLGAKLSE